ncbi:MAG: exopolysaccharide biosynthesis polyprenyl glycosylphosphotransferase [Candidatus Peribacteraceae bacterium]|jgi:exopolysaccharide biosynthesis polyprenyl glycosylphosphotransferase
MKKSEALFGLLRIPADVLAAGAALFLSFRLRQANIDLLPFVRLLEPAQTLPTAEYYVSAFILPAVLLFVALAAALKLYALRATMSAWTEMGHVVLAAALWVAVVNAWFFLVEHELFFSRAVLVHSVAFLILFVAVFRSWLILVQRAFLRRGVGRLLVVSLGSQAIAVPARDVLLHDMHYHYLGHLQDLAALKRVIHQQVIDFVIQTDPNPGSQETVALIEYCRSHHLGYGFLPPVLADVPHQLAVDRLGQVPLIRFQPTPLDGWGRVWKRLFDLLVSAVLIVLLLPFLLLFALGILLTSGWPIFYISTRVGEQGRTLVKILKFRTMVKNADALKGRLMAQNERNDGPLFKMRNDPRITPFGKFLRRWTLDEFPQLINVLLGQVSLVGPRPHLPSEVQKYSLEQRRVFAVKPGMTGLAQTSGRSDLGFEEEMKLDLRYIEEWSLLLDLWILWRTMFTVLSRKGAD